MNRLQKIAKYLLSPWSRGRGSGWRGVAESYPGAWQQNQELAREDLLSYHAIYAAMTLIAGDVSKLPLHLVRKDANNIWDEYESAAYSPVLRKPNHYQTRIQFFESWILSLLSAGNTFALKRRDGRNVVQALYILDPARVAVLVSESSGEVFYELSPDPVSGVDRQITVPASEIIHDRVNCLYSPLVGIPPIVACALPALQSRAIQDNAISFHKNSGRPGGILTAPGAISDEAVAQLKAHWKANYTGSNAGTVAVLADGLQYKSFEIATAQNSQVFEQLNWSAEVVASVFHIPPYKLGIGGETPTYNNIEALNVEYYGQAIQSRLEAIELLLDEGLSLPAGYGTEFQIDGLLRMDSKSLIEAEAMAVGAGIRTPNESRKRLNAKPLPGGDTAYLQQQYWSLSSLAARDAQANDNTDKFSKLMHNIKELAA